MEIRSIIIDDEQNNIENLRAIIESWCKDVSIVAVGSTVAEGIDIVNAQNPDLVFLDIQLHEELGFDMLKLLDKIEFEIIFITAYHQYGIQAVKFSALDYLLKPVDILELREAIERARQKIALKRQNLNLQNLLDFIRTPTHAVPKIALPTLEQTHYVRVSNITRCEASNNYTTFFLKDNTTILVSKTLKDFVELLIPYNFQRSHQSHLVNLDYVKSLRKEDGGTLLMDDGSIVPISRQNLDKIKTGLHTIR
ncbi:LytR/AlgR family response regulator transcription factor [Pedobacter duraquae]|uniref:LytTR family two component transcriptional regulator n=1 Tax=Pedobacter duraquae TaxID=425511 RepID=A0A4R6IG65_9SPHI|nr:LytTR family DNA-binding domain-containing protein [Pedobacter duraquae]TDO20688.1 LytTR family two component transcriptional regulator [Pedobacter duraquae]